MARPIVAEVDEEDAMSGDGSLLKNHLDSLAADRRRREREPRSVRSRIRRLLGLESRHAWTDGYVLRELYSVSGDGVATARPEKLVNDEAFQRSVRSISRHFAANGGPLRASPASPRGAFSDRRRGSTAPFRRGGTHD